MSPVRLARHEAEAAAAQLRLFAQPQRLMILAALLDGERSVSAIEAATGVSQPALSQQLADLRKGGAVLARRQSKLVFYRLAGDHIAHCVRSLCAMFGASEEQAAAPPPAPDRPGAAAKFARILSTTACL
ncbi:ArsR/SmtB family transcription factor [Thermaurantiacus sp.]